MPSKRPTRGRSPTLTATECAVLFDEPMPADANRFHAIMLSDPWRDPSSFGRSLRDLWRAHGPEIVARWVDDRPGTRPQTWWHYDAPRWLPDDPDLAGDWYILDQHLPEPRRRLGGIGTPKFECLAYVPKFWLGIPDDWLTRADLDALGDVDGVPIDPDDPPMFEAQAAYLKRHGLLRPGEAERLSDADVEPERVLIEQSEEAA